jgi:hypothetical protein
MTANIGKAQHIVLASHYLAQFTEFVLVVGSEYYIFHNLVE